MTVSNELYYAILSMDSYNRQRVSTDPIAFVVDGTQLGNATLREGDLANLPAGYDSIGFSPRRMISTARSLSPIYACFHYFDEKRGKRK